MGSGGHSPGPVRSCNRKPTSHALTGSTPSRSVELAETIDRSLKKSRTIELYYEDYTEEGTFKGTMTSLGCGLLLLGMFLLAVVGIAEQMGVPFLCGWPYLLLGAMGIFLAMQVLLLVSRKRVITPRDELLSTSDSHKTC